MLGNSQFLQSTSARFGMSTCSGHPIRVCCCDRNSLNVFCCSRKLVNWERSACEFRNFRSPGEGIKDGDQDQEVSKLEQKIKKNQFQNKKSRRVKVRTKNQEESKSEQKIKKSQSQNQKSRSVKNKNQEESKEDFSPASR